MLQFITNSSIPSVILEQAAAAIEGGCRWIQLRMKNSPHDTVLSTARELKSICAKHECILVIDDYVEIARELQLDGVHLGKNDMHPSKARMLLGMGCQDTHSHGSHWRYHLRRHSPDNGNRSQWHCRLRGYCRGCQAD